MSSNEFWMARLTAQTASTATPVEGYMPEFTIAEISQGVAQIRSRPVYHAALARYCDDQLSIDELNSMMAYWAWKQVRAKYPKRHVKGVEIERVAELAVLHYLNPLHEEQRSERSCASYVQVDRKTWASRYADQRTAIIHKLAEMKSEADIEINQALSRDEPEHELIKCTCYACGNVRYVMPHRVVG